MITAALELAINGWPVFPCDWRPGDHAKAPLIPSPGYHLATTDQDQIEEWWQRWPNAMIGARVPDSLIVIDIDPRNNPNGLAELIGLVGVLPRTLTAWSGRNDGGRHFYFLRPPRETTSTRLPEGVDLKKNGYCIVPPSIHPATGQPYWWEHRPVAMLPHALRELLRPAPRVPRVPKPNPFTDSKTGSGLVRTVAEAPDGQRHDALVWASFRARDDGILDEIEQDLIDASVSTGVSEKEAARVIGTIRRSES
jgi:hypothetical protein